MYVELIVRKSTSFQRKGAAHVMMEYEKSKVKLTRGTKELIREAINGLEPEYQDNRYKICEEVCRIVEDKFVGDNLSYQLSRMDMPTTRKVLEKIDYYIFSNQ